MRPLISRSRWQIGLWLVLVVPSSDAVAFQVMIRRPAAGEAQQSVFLPAPRNLRQHLTRARKAVQEERFGDAAEELYRLLHDPEENAADPVEAQDYFIPPAESSPEQSFSDDDRPKPDGPEAPQRNPIPGGAEGSVASGSRVRTSVRTEAIRLLGSMPERGRELYELRCGAEASTLLREAVASTDRNKLAEVTRRYFHTRAGYEATFLLGRYQLDHGYPLAAALCFERLADVPSASEQFGPGLALLLATSWQRAQMPDRARAVVVGLAGKRLRQPLKVGGKPVGMFAEGTDPLSWLAKVAGQPRHRPFAGEIQWTMFRGNPSRNAQSRGGLPLGEARWHLPVFSDRGDESAVEDYLKSREEGGPPPIPALLPLVVDNVVVMRTPEELIGVDFQTGKRVWRYPWDPLREASRPTGESDLTPDPFVRQGAPVDRRQRLMQRVWEDVPFGQLSSDGERVFLIEDLDFAETNFIQPNAIGFAMGTQNEAERTNRLTALSLAEQGKIRWSVGAADDTDEPKLAGFFFLGAPLPLHGQLYAIGEHHGEIRLVVLDAATGKLQWSQQLAHLEGDQADQEFNRRLVGATPSYAEGVLVCPTSAGAVVAVDLATRGLRWGYEYRTPTEHQGNMIFRANRVVVQQSNRRWAESTAVIAEGCVLLTPLESDEVHCLDLLTGVPKWKQKRGESICLACVHDGRAVFSKRDELVAMRLSDGSPPWEAAVKLDGAPSGRGFLSGQFFFLPTQRATLLKIDVTSGKVVETLRTPTVLGNLVCHEDQIISQSAKQLAVYYQIEPLRLKVAQRLAENADEEWAVARQSELLLHDGKHGEALASLRRLARMHPDDDELRSLLVRTLFAAIREDFVLNRGAADELAPLIQDNPEQRQAYWKLIGAALQKAGEYEAAFQAYLRIEQEPMPGGGTEVARALIDNVEPFLACRRDRWVQGELDQLLSIAGGSERERIDAVIQDRWQQALAQSGPEAIRRFLGLFSRHPLGSAARLELARRLAGEQPLEAELVLTRLVEQDHPEIAPIATARMAALLEATGRHELAGAYFQRLAERWAAVTIDGKTGREWFDDAMQREKPRAAIVRRVRWADGAVDVVEAPISPVNASLFPVPITSMRGPVAEGLTAAYSTSISYQFRGVMLLRDALGNEVQQFPVGEASATPVQINLAKTQLMGNGRLVVVCTGNEVFAVDRLGDKTSETALWRQMMGNNLTPDFGVYGNAVRQNPPAALWGEQRPEFPRILGSVTDQGVIFLRMRQLTCVDPVSGATIWSRDQIDLGSDLFCDDERVFVVSPGAQNAAVYSIIDGRLLGQRPIVPDANRWATLGGKLLSWIPMADQAEIGLVDVWTGEQLWSRKVSLGARGCLVGRDELAIIEPKGKFSVLAMQDGTPRVDADVVAEPRLEHLRVIRSREQYLAIVARHPTAPKATIQPLGALPTLTVRVHAFDRLTGRATWPTPAEVAHYSVPDQPADSPLLLFVRNEGPNRQQTTTCVLAIDRRDGREIWRRDGLQFPTNIVRVAANPQEQAVTVQLGNKSYAIKFTEEARPPAPPANSELRASVATLEGEVGKVTGAVIRALGNIVPGGPRAAPAQPPMPAKKE